MITSNNRRDLEIIRTAAEHLEKLIADYAADASCVVIDDISSGIIGLFYDQLFTIICEYADGSPFELFSAEHTFGSDNPGITIRLASTVYDFSMHITSEEDIGWIIDMLCFEQAERDVHDALRGTGVIYRPSSGYPEFRPLLESIIMRAEVTIDGMRIEPDESDDFYSFSVRVSSTLFEGSAETVDM